MPPSNETTSTSRPRISESRIDVVGGIPINENIITKDASLTPQPAREIGKYPINWAGKTTAKHWNKVIVTLRLEAIR